LSRLDELQPHEPVIFFDMGEEEKIIIDLEMHKACKFIKIVPTGFR
jgi:hypothetical protein